MTSLNIALPSGWRELSSEETDEGALVEYQYGTKDETRSIVTVLSQPSRTETYKLRLSIINTTSNHVRHDYPIAEYESPEAAITEAESFIKHLSTRLHEGAVPATNPDIKELRGMIKDFSEDRVFPSLRAFFRRLA